MENYDELEAIKEMIAAALELCEEFYLLDLIYKLLA